ncbi:MAG: hypothetical protein JWM88_3345 [Verrucomicrobia bacterium]|nr:hypothetical protein [Verrucomicrobiota bacterium]
MKSPSASVLPYVDTKPVGSADFYFAVNATFRFILGRLGREGWIRYLEEMGRGYFDPVNRQWSRDGLAGLARYWREFFQAEPNAVVNVVELPDRVEVRVSECPAIKHLRAGQREIVREYCQHCFYLGSARAEAAGLTMRLAGGNGSCCHTFAPAATGLAPQDLQQIREATS